MVMAEANYDFIVNPDSKPSKPLLPGGDSMKGRIIIVVGGLIAFIIVALIAITLLSSGGKENRAQLVKLAQAQAEIVRVSTLGTERARSSASQNLAITTSLTLQSDSAQLLAALDKQGIKISKKDLAAGKDAKTDAALTAAEQSNQFDTIFIQTIQAMLVTYQKDMQAAYEASKSKNLKAVLEQQFSNAAILAERQQ